MQVNLITPQSGVVSRTDYIENEQLLKPESPRRCGYMSICIIPTHMLVKLGRRPKTQETSELTKTLGPFQEPRTGDKTFFF